MFKRLHPFKVVLSKIQPTTIVQSELLATSVPPFPGSLPTLCEWPCRWFLLDHQGGYFFEDQAPASNELGSHVSVWQIDETDTPLASITFCARPKPLFLRLSRTFFAHPSPKSSLCTAEWFMYVLSFPSVVDVKTATLKRDHGPRWSNM